MTARRPVVECPECGERTRIHPEHAGTLVKCSHCRQWFAASAERERFRGREVSHTVSRYALGVGAFLLGLAGAFGLAGEFEQIVATAFVAGALVCAGLAALPVRHDLHSALNFGLTFLGALAVTWRAWACYSETRSELVIVAVCVAGLTCFFAGELFWGEIQMALFGRTRFRSWFGNWFDRLYR